VIIVYHTFHQMYLYHFCCDVTLVENLMIKILLIQLEMPQEDREFHQVFTVLEHICVVSEVTRITLLQKDICMTSNELCLLIVSLVIIQANFRTLITSKKDVFCRNNF